MRLIYILALVALTSCGGGTEQGPAPAGDVSKAISSNRTTDEIRMILQMIESDPTDDSNLRPQEFATFAKGDFDNCKKFVIGSVESDPHYKIAYDCKDIVISGEGVVTQIGHYELKSEDPTDLSLGYMVDYEMVINTIFEAGSFSDYTVKGKLSNTQTKKQLIFDWDYSWKFKSDRYKPINLDWTWERKVRRVYTPDNMAKPMDNGTLYIESFFTVLGDMGPDMDKKPTYGDFTLEMISKDIVYDTTCSYYFKEGTLEFKDGAKNTIKVDYDCADRTVYFNGKEIKL
jgi:hypothetical protein